MMSPQEGLYTKIAAIAGVVGLFIAFLAWIHPFAPRSDTPAADTGKTTSSEPPVPSIPGAKPLEPVHHESSDESRLTDSGKPSADGASGAVLNGEDGRAQPHSDLLDLAKPTRVCDAPETAILRPGVPARVASGLAVLSVKTAREGSESYLTLSIASDRGTLAEAVLGAPARFHFKTSRGAYFVNVEEADLAVGAITVEVGCEAKESTL
jgi:hypothetical protein